MSSVEVRGRRKGAEICRGRKKETEKILGDEKDTAGKSIFVIISSTKHANTNSRSVFLNSIINSNIVPMNEKDQPKNPSLMLIDRSVLYLDPI